MFENPFEEIVNKESGVITSPLQILPNRHFMPSSLVQTSVSGKNLLYAGCTQDKIIASGINFNLEKSIFSTIGEFFERYCASISKNSANYVYGNYNNLIKDYNLINPEISNIFSNQQYLAKDFSFKKLDKNIHLTWIKGHDYFSNETVFYPSNFVHLFSFDRDITLPSTSTGLAAGSSFENAITGRLLECFERHAFAKFWYHQNINTVIKYSKETILTSFTDDTEIQLLFNTNNNLVIFDLTELTFVPTILIVSYFKCKGKIYYSCGCASRFNMKEALKKAMLECYQGYEYAIVLEEENKDKITALKSFEIYKHLKDFKYHFWFYNAFPELRDKIPIFKETFSRDNYLSEIISHKHVINEDNLRSSKELIGDIYCFDLSIKHIKEMNFYVTRVIAPRLILLSGHAKYPFLGYDCFERNSDLYLDYPHFFP